jgi:RimJ/RimL family protein N-acetyltransferase
MQSHLRWKTLTTKLRGLTPEDTSWVTEVDNDAETARYLVSIFPVTEHELKEAIKKELEEGKTKCLVAELDNEPAGYVGVEPSTGRSRHVAWIGIFVRRKHWSKGVGNALMQGAIGLAKDLGCRKLMLGAMKGNERATNLYKKSGFQEEGYEREHTYIDGSWRDNVIMGLEIAACQPRIDNLPSASSNTREDHTQIHDAGLSIRQLMDHDLDQLHRLQNCVESTKSSKRVPPTPKEKTKQWYEELKVDQGKLCLACFENDNLLGYLRFMAQYLPFPNLLFEEMIVDLNAKPEATAEALVSAIKDFKERYGYHRIFAYVPQTSLQILKALESHGFINDGAMRNYYFINEHYVDVAIYGYP